MYKSCIFWHSTFSAHFFIFKISIFCFCPLFSAFLFTHLSVMLMLIIYFALIYLSSSFLVLSSSHFSHFFLHVPHLSRSYFFIYLSPSFLVLSSSHFSHYFSTSFIMFFIYLSPSFLMVSSFHFTHYFGFLISNILISRSLFKI